MSFKQWWDALPHWLRWIINRIDDPWDNLVQKLNGAVIFGYRIRLGCIMKNKDYGCSIKKV